MADCTQAPELTAGIPAQYLLADRTYDTNAIVAEAVAQGMEPVILPRSHLKEPRYYDEDLYRLRNFVENSILHFKQWRGVATRDAKRPSSSPSAAWSSGPHKSSPSATSEHWSSGPNIRTALERHLGTALYPKQNFGETPGPRSGAQLYRGRKIFCSYQSVKRRPAKPRDEEDLSAPDEAPFTDFAHVTVPPPAGWILQGQKMLALNDLLAIAEKSDCRLRLAFGEH